MQGAHGAPLGDQPLQAWKKEFLPHLQGSWVLPLYCLLLHIPLAVTAQEYSLLCSLFRTKDWDYFPKLLSFGLALKLLSGDSTVLSCGLDLLRTSEKINCVLCIGERRKILSYVPLCYNITL